MNREILYTVGHSNQTFEEFMQLLIPHEIDCIIDVRSMPYSKYTPQFNSEQLKAQLNKHGILYAHFGNEFGAAILPQVQCTGSKSFMYTRTDLSKGSNKLKIKRMQ